MVTTKDNELSLSCEQSANPMEWLGCDTKGKVTYIPGNPLNIPSGLQNRKYSESFLLDNGPGSPGFKLVVSNPHMRRIYEVIDRIKDYDTNIFISGESGTGKSMLARLVYNLSPRAAKPFVEVNCGSLSDNLLESELFGHVRGAFTGALRTRVGKLEEARDGTLLLDDITSASYEMQTKLLHVLENKKIQRVGDNSEIRLNTRFICAGNKNVAEEIKQKRFREDLFFRISVVHLKLPPLRERVDEIMPLINLYIRYYNRKYGRKVKGLCKGDEKKALTYSWPGNIRELKNAVERSLVFSEADWIRLDICHLADDPQEDFFENGASSLPEMINEFEKKVLLSQLGSCDWDIETAAKKLKVSRSTLFNKIKKHDIRRPGRM